MTQAVDRVAQALDDWLAASPRRPLILGLCGAQGSGKSTLATALRDRLAQAGRRAAILSLDDLYLPGAARVALAADVHPLLRTRGVPLTHDVAAGIHLLTALRAGQATALPRFDKATDEPLAQAAWPLAEPPLDVVIFEGWCVGARPQPQAALADPVNALERDEDPDGRWRHAVNAALAGPYAALFALVDRLVLLAAPDFAVVTRWRGEQEEALRCERHAAGHDTRGLMDPPGVARFVQHYERLTRWILAEMPARADLVLHLDTRRRIVPDH